MAIAIKNIPTLQGNDAERFLKMAETVEHNTNKTDISKNIWMVSQYLRSQNN